MPMRRWVSRLPNTIAQKQNECLRALQLFRRTTSKSVEKYFEKTIDKSFPLWYNILVRLRETVRQSLDSGVPVGATADRPQPILIVEPPRTRTAGGVWQPAFLTPRAVANVAIPEEPRPITCA